LFNIKTGTGIGYKKLLTSVQFSYVSSQYTEANNSITDKMTILMEFLEIPSYYVCRFFGFLQMEKWKLEAGVTNFTNNSYFTQSYRIPGPGIIPSDARSFYTTLEFVFKKYVIIKQS
jgi:Fe(3+) dicitrate transport protein